MTLRNALVPLAALASLTACDRAEQPSTAPAGAQTSATTGALKAGAAVLQGEGPLNGFNVHLVGFHPMKAEPQHQMEAHHFCRQVNEDFAQCVLFDGGGADANMTGLEYIISEKLFDGLPAQERRYWHPHNGEILSGQLVAPGLPRAAEKALMKRKINSYGKTWHSWATDRGDRLPMGDAMLAWSFSRDNELDPALLARRDQALGIDTAKVRQSRQDLTPLARPQEGVDALKGKYPRPTRDIPGVTSR